MSLILNIILSLVILCFTVEVRAAEKPVKPCESDTRTLAELLQSNPPYSNKVPKDFMIEQHVERYVTVNPTYSYNLPSQTDPLAKTSGAGLGANYRDTAECKVKAPDGTSWIVEGTGGSQLDYVLESAVLPEKIYNVRANAGNAAWRKCSNDYLSKEKAGIIAYNSPNDCLEQAKRAEDQAEKELTDGNQQ